MARDEQGTGVFASVAGVLAFLVLLLLAVQVLFDLYATSAVTAATFDAARLVAGSGDGGTRPAPAEAEARAADALGAYAERVRFRWDLSDPDVVALRAEAENPSVLPAVFARPLGVDRVERTVRVRTERAGP